MLLWPITAHVHFPSLTKTWFIKKKPNVFYPVKMKQNHKRVSPSFKILRFYNVIIQCRQPHDFTFFRKTRKVL